MSNCDCIFENMAGPNINFDKSEIMLIIEDGIKLGSYDDIFN
jgi:hypothetical protein